MKSAEKHSYPYPVELKLRCFVPIKLSGSNSYYKWRMLMLRLMETQGLLGFVNGEASAPPEMIKVADADDGSSTSHIDEIETQNYRAWKRSDALLQSWIIGTVTGDLLKILEDLKTARQMWAMLERAFKDFPQKYEEYPYPSEVKVKEFVPIMLCKGNYSTWKPLMLSLVEAQGLGGFINGKVSPPPATIKIRDDSTTSHSHTEKVNNVLTKSKKKKEKEKKNSTVRRETENIVADHDCSISQEKQVESAVDDSENSPNHSDTKAKEIDTKDTDNIIGPCDEPKETERIHADATGYSIESNDDEEHPDRMENISTNDSSISQGDTNKIENGDYKAWKKSDALLQSWIIGTTNEDLIPRLVKCKTARNMWAALEQIMEDSGSDPETESHVEEKDWQLYRSLYNAAIKGEWKSVEKVLKEKPEVVKAKITRKSHTLLMLALKAKKSDQFVKNLLKHMSKDDLTVTSSYGITALHRAAIEGNVEAAKLMVEMNPDLPNMCADGVYPPLFYAALWGRRDMTLYLLKVTREEFITKGDDGAKLVLRLIHNSIYDVALHLVKRHKLACKTPSTLELLAWKPSGFPSGVRYNWWQSLIYYYVPLKFEETAYGNGGDIENPTASNGFVSVVMQKLLVLFWKLTEISVPQMKQIQEKKLRHSHALELLRYVCKEMEELKCPMEMVGKAFDSAVDRGIYEVIEEISVTFPRIFFRYGVYYYQVFHTAIINRNQKVFNLIYQFREEDRSFFLSRRDKFGNNGLHLAGCLQNEQRLQLRIEAVGAALQMQRELQWYKEVEKLIPSNVRHLRNANNKTPIKLFTETHQDLVKEGERWMKDTATSCSIVAALIVTIAFAATITVPGGNLESSGLPIFFKVKAFKAFGVSNALALFTSTSSVLMFLSILTSRYAEKDFLYDLPTKLIIGLVMLFVSIISMIIAFSAAFYLVFGDGKTWILIPLIIFSFIPVTLFVCLQFPLLFTMIKSTYFPHIFQRQRDRLLML